MADLKPLRLGIVGGLGAVAGADLLYRIVKSTPVRSEGDHRELVFEQKPMREPSAPMDRDYSPTHRKFYVFDTLSHLEAEGCGAAILPCFVTHSFLGELQDELKIKLISMTDAIKDAVLAMDNPPQTVGVITTPYVRHSGLFDSLFGTGIRVVYPSLAAETAVMQSIYGPNGFKSGNYGDQIIQPINAALEDLQGQGVDLFVPGLTEIPILLDQLAVPTGMAALNTAEVYAQHALKATATDRQRRFKVGVVGGVGPAATVDFMSKLVGGTEAARDQDHIKVLVEQNPQIPDRTENLVADGIDPTVALYSTCKKLERGGADIIAIPCNTAHAYVDRIQRHLDIPIVSILSSTTDFIRATSPETRKVGILATNGTIQSGLYQEALRQADLDFIIPDETHQALVMQSIYGPEGVKAGVVDGLCKAQIAQAFAHLVARGAEAVILGCTELPLIVTEEAAELGAIPVDPTKVLAEKCVSLAQSATKAAV
ncbi:amino acid racemase [Cognatishimia sp. SS12]|uniref:aspartate/glutamate racemase family protein n=1 Tax=Cognatishimia sp. SS12 TaxID=2979465 RepID=UPI00232E9BB8|nr:amino acid racemase [Cognatishimia sp. SS12]MDC0738290.1 amino acid racemase [Cognatishimia sp. SS12]